MKNPRVPICSNNQYSTLPKVASINTPTKKLHIMKTTSSLRRLAAAIVLENPLASCATMRPGAHLLWTTTRTITTITAFSRRELSLLFGIANVSNLKNVITRSPERFQCDAAAAVLFAGAAGLRRKRSQGGASGRNIDGWRMRDWIVAVLHNHRTPKSTSLNEIELKELSTAQPWSKETSHARETIGSPAQITKQHCHPLLPISINPKLHQLDINVLQDMGFMYSTSTGLRLRPTICKNTWTTTPSDLLHVQIGARPRRKEVVWV